MEQTSNPEYHVRIRELPSSERPRERLRDHGADALTSAELLAIVLRSGTSKLSAIDLAQNLLKRHNGLGGLARLSFADLVNEPGVGEAKAAEIRAVFQLAARIQALEVGERPTIRSPADIYALLAGEMAPLDQEHLRVVLMNSRNQVTGIHEIYVGNVKSAIVRPAEIFRHAIHRNQPSIVLVHNHPSGDPAPSADDVNLTKSLVAVGHQLDIRILDHVIIGDHKFASLQSLDLWSTTSANGASLPGIPWAGERGPD